MMFSLLTDTTVQIERLRAFGIPTLDDAAAVMLSSWLQGAVQNLVKKSDSFRVDPDRQWVFY